MGTVTLSPGQLPAQPVAGFPGQLSRYDEGGTRLRIGTWSGSPTVDIWTATVGTGTASFAYTLTYTPVGGYTNSVVFTSTNTTTDDIAAGLAAAWNADPQASAYGYATVASSVVTITGISGQNNPLPFTVSTNSATSAKVSMAHTQTASPGGVFNVARAAIVDGQNWTNPAPQVLPVTALSAKAASGTIAYAAGAIYSWTLSVAGKVYQGSVAADTNTATTLTAWLASINGALPPNTVVATSGGAGTYTLTAEVAGQSFGFSCGTTGGTLTFTDSNQPTDDINLVCIGVSCRTAAMAGNDLADSALVYPGGQAIQFCEFGFIWVDTTSTPSILDPVYVDNVTGMLGNSSGSTKALLLGAKWTGRNAYQGVYEVQLVGNVT